MLMAHSTYERKSVQQKNNSKNMNLEQSNHLLISEMQVGNKY